MLGLHTLSRRSSSAALGQMCNLSIMIEAINPRPPIHSQFHVSMSHAILFYTLLDYCTGQYMHALCNRGGPGQPPFRQGDKLKVRVKPRSLACLHGCLDSLCGGSHLFLHRFIAPVSFPAMLRVTHTLSTTCCCMLPYLLFKSKRSEVPPFKVLRARVVLRFNRLFFRRPQY